VAAGANCRKQVMLASKSHGLDDVCGRCASGNHRGVFIEHAVPDTSSRIVPVLPRDQNLPAQAGRKVS
jgi:hypothetical protein